jgi:hypothetical protein
MRARFAFNPRRQFLSHAADFILAERPKRAALSLRHQRINYTPCVRPAREFIYKTPRAIIHKLF